MRDESGLWKPFMLVVIGALVLLGSGIATASPIPFGSGSADYQVNNRLSEVVPRFFRDQGLDVVLSPGVTARTGTINGHFEGTYAAVWQTLAETNGLIGYYDGSRVYVYLESERETEFSSVPLQAEQPFIDAMTRVSWQDTNNRWDLEASSGLITIQGVPRFIQQVKQMAGTVSNLSQDRNTTFKFYPLKHAWATDTTMTIGDRDIVISGVASVLRALVGQGDGSFAGTRETRRTSRRGLRGSGMAGAGGRSEPLPPFGNGAEMMDDGGYDDSGMLPGTAGIQTVVDGADVRIVADGFRNAVIVRDRPDRLPMYDTLIAQLDVPQRMIEIEATLIDVDKGKLRDLGIDWYYRNRRTSVGFAPDDATKARLLYALGARDSSLLRHTNGFQLGAILGNPAHFIASVHALEGTDVTHVVTHPQVITMNDVPAVIAHTETIYVPVEGTYSTDLYDVVAGTTLNVTPHILQDEEDASIRLRVQIRDGGYKLANVGRDNAQYPIVTDTMVNTQAVIRDGQGLLLGGMVQQSLSRGEQRVPILGSIPVLGNLFKRVSASRGSVERLFLITPRLVLLNRITGQQTPSSPEVTMETQQQLDKEEADRDAWWNYAKRKANPVVQPAPLPPIEQFDPTGEKKE